MVKKNTEFHIKIEAGDEHDNLVSCQSALGVFISKNDLAVASGNDGIAFVALRGCYLEQHLP